MALFRQRGECRCGFKVSLVFVDVAQKQNVPVTPVQPVAKVLSYRGLLFCLNANLFTTRRFAYGLFTEQ